MKAGFIRPAASVLSILVILTLLLGACSPAAQSPSQSGGATGSGSGSGGGKVTLEYWDWWVTQSPTIDREIALFEQANPDIKIKKTTQVFDKYPELLQLAIKSGNAPDVFLIPQKPKLVEQIKLGWLLPLNQWASKEWQSQFPQGSFAEGDNVVEGKVYTAPYDGAAPWLQLYVNTKMFKDAGLVDGQGNVKLPQTWAEVREYAQIVTKAGGGQSWGYGFGDKQKVWLARQMAMVQNSGAPGGVDGNSFDLRTGRYTWAANPVYLEWINFFMGMKQDGSIYPNAMSVDDEMARQLFAQNKIAMLIGGVWNQTGWAQTNPDFKDYTLVNLPFQGPTQESFFYRSPGAGGTAFGISAKTKHAEAAWKWFAWLNSKAAAERWVKDGQGIRIFPEVNKPEYAPTPQFAAFMKLTEGVKLAPAPNLKHPEMTEVKEQATLPNIQNILEGIYTGQLTDWEGALRDLEARQNAAFEQAIKDAQARGIKVDPNWYKVPDWDVTEDYIP
jgi:ABC-type glycerol-3-phosphate transport system substrate-binding protein